jgi:hypothetical protein
MLNLTKIQDVRVDQGVMDRSARYRHRYRLRPLVIPAAW